MRCSSLAKVAAQPNQIGRTAPERKDTRRIQKWRAAYEGVSVNVRSTTWTDAQRLYCLHDEERPDAVPFLSSARPVVTHLQRRPSADETRRVLTLSPPSMAAIQASQVVHEVLEPISGEIISGGGSASERQRR